MADRKQFNTWRRRIKTLVAELSKLEGFIHMTGWMAEPNTTTDEGYEKFLKRARKNPCGTAACIAGKAGLMDVFRKEGFYWDYYSGRGGFSIEASAFFGQDVHYSVFTGYWAVRNIDTPQQAVIVLQAFLKEWTWATYQKVRGSAEDPFLRSWMPPAAIRDRVEALRVKEKFFPVHGWGSQLIDDDWRHWQSKATMKAARKQMTEAT